MALAGVSIVCQGQAAETAGKDTEPTTMVVVVDHGRFTTDTLITHDRATTGDLVMTFSNLRSDDGYVRFGLFANEEGWPAEWTLHAVAWGNAPIAGGRAVVVVRNLPAGPYGMNGYHDENANNTLDAGLLGIPKEGYCFTTNFRPRLSAPKFQDVVFDFKPASQAGAMAVDILMQYR